MNPKGILVIDAFGLLLIALIVYLVSRQKLHVGFGLLWLLTTVGAMTLVSIARLRDAVTPAVGAVYPASALSLLAFVFVFVVLIFFSVKLTALSARQTRILQALALMEQETREPAGNWSGNLDEEQSPQRSE
jgi:hypothetical protein